VTGGSTYPWPLADWADARVDPNPASLAVTSIAQDAQAHQRWHPAGDGYQPQPGDWVVFSGHVEVITGYAGGTLDTIGADSLPGLTVNAHSFRGPLGDDGVAGFVDNGNLKPASTAATAGGTGSGGTGSAAADTGSAAADTGARSGNQTVRTDARGAQIPGVVTPVPATPTSAPTPTPAVSAAPAAARPAVTREPYRKHTAQQQATAPGTQAQQAFISLIAPGAIAAQQRFGVPAAVTIAQAIEESAWGNSGLAAQDHNLFGIKGTGPAGSVTLPTSEYLSGQWVSTDAPFRVYRNVAESIADHAELLATSGYYTRAMADRAVPDAFANDLTGVYATDPDYGANLIALMRLYNLYRFDATTASQHVAAPQPAASHVPASHIQTSHIQTSHPQTSHPQTSHPQTSHPPSSHPAAASATGTAGHASIPGMAAPTLAPTAGTVTSSASASAGFIPGAVSPSSFGLTSFTPATAAPSAPAATAATATAFVTRYKPQLPTAVSNAWLSTAKVPLMHAEQLYREVAGHAGIRWELLAACDWMQCKSHPRYSPVHGEKIGTLNADGTAYRTKSQALAQCASDLVTLAAAVYRIDLTSPRPLPVRSLADAFAAFRWGSLLKRHRVSALEFPYSVAGLTEQHTKMHWPAIDDQDAPDRPGARFREPFGAVPVVLSLDYPATVLIN
jgi:flagellum-specific peptidoglycan hydrolase FlgJ